MVNANQKGRVLVSFMGVPSKVHNRGRPRKAGETIITRDTAQSYQEPNLPVTLWGCYLGHVLGRGVSIASRPLKPTWPHKMHTEESILWSSLAKLSKVCKMRNRISDHALVDDGSIWTVCLPTIWEATKLNQTWNIFWISMKLKLE